MKSLIKTDVDLTLMVLNSEGDYQPSNIATFQYFLAVAPDFTAELGKNALEVLVALYNEHYRIFREREPNDVNYIAVVGVRPTVATAAEVDEKPWLYGQCPVWEWSNLIEVTSEGYLKHNAESFEKALIN